MKLRAMVRESDSKPFKLSMDNGRSYTVSHPDFAMVADGAVIIGSAPGRELGGASFVICYLEHARAWN